MKGAKPKRGRRPLADGRAKSIMFCLRLTPAEQQRIKEAALAEGKEPSAWARDLLLHVADVTLARTDPDPP